jgi:type IV pilus assembly protein PilE
MDRTNIGIRQASAGQQACAQAGFSLVDLVVAMLIAAVLASIAVPSYRAELTRTRRTDARTALLALAAAEESFHTTCNTYATTLEDTTESSCGTSSLRFPGIAGQGAYSVAVTSADATSWAALATAIAGGPQQADTRCRALGLTSTGNRTARTADGTSNHEECWNR